MHPHPAPAPVSPAKPTVASAIAALEEAKNNPANRAARCHALRLYRATHGTAIARVIGLTLRQLYPQAL